MCKLKNRYLRADLWLLGWLRSLAAGPVAVLLGFLLCANAVAGDYYFHRHSQSPAQTNLYALDGDQDLSATAVEGRELRSGREKTENTFGGKLEVSYTRHQFRAIDPSLTITPRFFSAKPFLSVVSHVTPLFSPRPPPLFSARA